MAENTKARDPGVPTAFRVPRLRRLQIELISKELGHPHLSTTLNAAVDLYVERYLRREIAA